MDFITNEFIEMISLVDNSPELIGNLLLVSVIVNILAICYFVFKR
jgi:hypothetical protein